MVSIAVESSKPVNFGCGCGGIGGFLLTAAIIAARAFCSKIPMEEWSFGSWILMTLPISIPVLLGISFLFVWIVFAIFFSRRGSSW